MTTETAAPPHPLQGHQPNEDERLWSLLAHLSPIIGLSFIGPILALVIKGEQSKWVRMHAIEAINFNLTCVIFAVVSIPLTFLFGIGFCTLSLVGLANLVFAIIASVKGWQGHAYRYPLTLRMLKD